MVQCIKVYLKDFGHMTMMDARPIAGKNHQYR